MLLGGGARSWQKGFTLSRVRTIFYDHSNPERAQPGFRSGEAGLVTAHPEGGLDSDSRVKIAPNSLHAPVMATRERSARFAWSGGSRLRRG